MKNAVRVAAYLLLAAAVVAGAFHYLAHERRLGDLGFPIDDAWIHAQFARNLAAGQGMSFNAGEPSTGSTAPLWTWLLALPMLAGMGAVAGAKLLGVVAAVAAAILAFELTWTAARSGAAAFVAGFAVALSPRFAWGAVSGMEVPLYTALVAAALLVFVREHGGRGWLWGALCALAVLARPEVAVLFPLLVGVAMWARSGSPRRRSLWAAGLVFVVIVGGDLVLNVVMSGRPLPATFYAKADGVGLLNAMGSGDWDEARRSLLSRPIDTLNTFVRYCADQSLLLMVFALPGALALARVLKPVGDDPGAPLPALAIPTLVIVAPLMMGLVAPVFPTMQQEGRYFGHVLLAFFVLGAAGASALARRSARPWIVWAVAALAVVRLGAQDVKFAPTYALQVDNINRLQVAMGRWLEAHTPSDALIATNDIGAIAFMSHRRILDLEGLTTPGIVPYKRARRHFEFLEQKRPAMVVMFDEWYPHLAARTETFTEVHRITVPRVTAAHDTFKAYRANWRP